MCMINQRGGGGGGGGACNVISRTSSLPLCYPLFFHSCAIYIYLPAVRSIQRIL